MKKILPPLIFALAGLGLGGAAGLYLKPAEEPAPSPEAGAGDKDGDEEVVEETPVAGPEDDGAVEFVKMDRQFVVPVVDGAKIGAMIVISLAVEVDQGGSSSVFSYEPKLRDAFLQVMFLHAQSGGFSGAFNAKNVMDDLRAALTASARSVLGPSARSVLVTNIVRQDI